VRSLGYSNLFVLSKADLWDTLKYYPEYQAILKQKVRQLMKLRENYQNDNLNDEIDVESIINTSHRPSTPRLIHTVMQMVPPESRISQILSRSSSITRSSISMTPSTKTLFQSQSPINTALPNIVTNNQNDQIEQQYHTMSTESDLYVDNGIINDIVYDL